MYVRNVHDIGSSERRRRTDGAYSNSVILWVTVVSLRGWANNDIRPTRLDCYAATASALNNDNVNTSYNYLLGILQITCALQRLAREKKKQLYV